MVSMIRRSMYMIMLVSMVGLIGCSSEVSAPAPSNTATEEQLNYDMGSDQLFLNVGDDILLPLPIGTLLASANIGLEARPEVLLETAAFQDCVQGLVLTLRSSVAQLQADAQQQIEEVLASVTAGRIRPAAALALIQNIRTRLQTNILSNPVRTKVTNQLQACAAGFLASVTDVLTNNQLIRARQWALNVILI